MLPTNCLSNLLSWCRQKNWVFECILHKHFLNVGYVCQSKCIAQRKKWNGICLVEIGYYLKTLLDVQKQKINLEAWLKTVKSKQRLQNCCTICYNSVLNTILSSTRSKSPHMLSSPQRLNLVTVINRRLWLRCAAPWCKHVCACNLEHWKTVVLSQPFTGEYYPKNVSIWAFGSI